MTKHRSRADTGTELKPRRDAASICVHTAEGPVVLRQAFREALPHLLARLGRWG